MPSITFSFDDLCSLVGQKLDDKKLAELLDKAKAELDSKLSSEITVKYNDTNQPYLWSVEGLARHFRASLGKEKGIAKLKLEKPVDGVTVDKSVSSVRPYIAVFSAKGPKLSEYLLNQLIQMQEKLADNFGRKRQKVAIGLVPANKVALPLLFKAVDPSEHSFVPLGSAQEMTLKSVLEKTDKGRQYASILKDAKKVPVVIDSEGDIVTFPPIINSDTSGRLQVGDTEILCEVTGTDWSAVNLVSVIFAYALSERDFSITPFKVKSGKEQIVTPDLSTEKMKFDFGLVESLLGLKLSASEIKGLLERAQFDVSGSNVEVPAYRRDVMHPVDIAEDVGIQYGYSDIEPLPLSSLTTGGFLPVSMQADTHRVLWIGLGFQEVMSAVLSSKELLFDRLNVAAGELIEIDNPISQTYSCLRSWLLPILLDVLSKNRHVDYPQKLFEQGLVMVRDCSDVRDESHLSAVSAHSQASFTEMRQYVEATLKSIGLSCQFEELEMGCFIVGRSAKVLVDGKEVGIVGEIHPAVLKKLSVLVPIVGCELNLSSLKK